MTKYREMLGFGSFIEACEEIERLRADNTRLQAQLETAQVALEWIAHTERPGTYDNDPLGFGIVSPTYKKAREALEKMREGK